MSAANYYLAPQGADNAAGSINAPWKNLDQAQNKMGPGDTVFVRGGTFAGVNLNWTKSGTAGKPMVIKAYPKETPIFTGSGLNYFVQSTGQYIVFDGLEISGYTRSAFNPTGGGFLTIRNCNLHNILANEYGAITPQNCHDILIENNVFREMGRSLDQTLFDHAVYNAAGSHDIVIRNNLFMNSHGGPAINHYHTPSPYNVLICNNVFIMTLGAERSGVFVGDGAHDVKVYNNTFYLDGKGATKCYGVHFNSGFGTNEAVNNLFYFSNWPIDDAVILPGNDKADYNLYFPAKDADDAGAHSFAADPLFADAAGTDLHLAASSPAINKGMTLPSFAFDKDGNQRPIGGGFDIGAYESKDGITGIIGRWASGKRASSGSSRKSRVSLEKGSLIFFDRNKSPAIQGTEPGGFDAFDTFDAKGGRLPKLSEPE